MPSKVYVCDACGFSDISKTRFETHCQRMKHKKNTLPELARQLDNIKMERLEMKTNLKKEELEKDLELKQKAMELKEQIKEDLAKSAEKCITKKEMEKSVGGDEFISMLIDKPQIEDYNDMFNGIISFQELFQRDFLELYETNKVIVIDKGQLNVGYWINNAPCHTRFYLDDPIGNGLKRILTTIHIYHQYLKDYAKINGCNVKDFYLSQVEKKELEDWIKEEITFFHYL